MSSVSADSFAIGMVTCSLFNGKYKDGDEGGPFRLEAASCAAAGLPRAPRLLLEHVDGVFVLHLQLGRGVRLVDRLPIEPEPNLSH